MDTLQVHNLVKTSAIMMGNLEQGHSANTHHTVKKLAF
jgi:hypothetical protein